MPSTTTCILKPGRNDVLLGRGYAIRMNQGNHLYRSLIKTAKPQFDAAPVSLRGIYGYQIVNHIRSLDPPGRFLRMDNKKSSSSGLWIEVSTEEAVYKVRQALRDANKTKIRHQSSRLNGNKNGDNGSGAKKLQEVSYILLLSLVSKTTKNLIHVLF